MGNWFSDNFNESFPISIRDENYGWKPDIPDQRDLFVKFPIIKNISDSIDLRSDNEFIYKQNNNQASVACAVVAAFDYENYKINPDKHFISSPLFIYYNQRVIDNNIQNDNGGSIRDTIKAINKLGVCDYNLWNSSNKINIRPNISAYLDAQKNKRIKYKRVKKDINTLQTSLILKYPIIFGFTVYNSFNLDENNIMILPSDYEKVYGTHCGLIYGYNNINKTFLIKNCFNDSWGEYGFFYIPYEFITGPSCSDFWVIEKIKKVEDNLTMKDIIKKYEFRNDNEIKKSNSEISIVDI